jgi:hypothetical protein
VAGRLNDFNIVQSFNLQGIEREGFVNDLTIERLTRAYGEYFLGAWCLALCRGNIVQSFNRSTNKGLCRRISGLKVERLVERLNDIHEA